MVCGGGECSARSPTVAVAVIAVVVAHRDETKSTIVAAAMADVNEADEDGAG